MPTRLQRRRWTRLTARSLELNICEKHSWNTGPALVLSEVSKDLRGSKYTSFRNTLSFDVALISIHRTEFLRTVVTNCDDLDHRPVGYCKGSIGATVL